MGTRLVYDVVNRPVWLLKAESSEKFHGTPEPGRYDFEVTAYVVENEIQSAVSRKRLAGVVPFQDPIWQTSATQDAIFTEVSGQIQVEATSYEARVTYEADQAVRGTSVSPQGLLEYNFSEPGGHLVPIKAIARAKDGAEAVTEGMHNPAILRVFKMWALKNLDTRMRESIVSDLVQSLVDKKIVPAHLPALAYAADPEQVDEHCDVRAIVYAAGLTPGLSSASSTLKLGGVSVFTHSVVGSSETQYPSHKVLFPGVDGDADKEFVFDIGSRIGIFVALFDRRTRTVSISTLPEPFSTVRASNIPSTSPTLASSAPQYWSGLEWIHDAAAATSNSAFISTIRDARIPRILDSTLVPHVWPRSAFGQHPDDVQYEKWAGAWKVGYPMHIQFQTWSGSTSGDLTFEILGISLPGLKGQGTDVLRGTPEEPGSFIVVTRATETETHSYSTADVQIEAVRMDWPAIDTIRGRVGDTISTTASLQHSHVASIATSFESPGSGLEISSKNYIVTIAGTYASKGTHYAVAESSTTFRDVTLTEPMRIEFVVAHQLPIWTLPRGQDLAMAYIGEEHVVNLDAYAPEPIVYRLSPDEKIDQDEQISVVGSELAVSRLRDGYRSIIVEAFVDHETIVENRVATHTFAKREMREMAEIASISESDLLTMSTPNLSHATDFPASGPVYRYGAHVMFAFDTSVGSIGLRCNGIPIVNITNSGDSARADLLPASFETSIRDTTADGAPMYPNSFAINPNSTALVDALTDAVQYGGTIQWTQNGSSSVYVKIAEVRLGVHFQGKHIITYVPVEGMAAPKSYTASTIRVMPRAGTTESGQRGQISSRLAIMVVTLLPDGQARIRSGSADIGGWTRWPSFGADTYNTRLNYELTNGAMVGSVYAVPFFDPSAIVAASYELTRPHFVPTSTIAYVYTAEAFKVHTVTQTPDPRLHFSVARANKVQSPAVDGETARLVGVIPQDGAASVTLRATRANGTWIESVISLEGLTIRWPGQHLGEATIGTSKKFDVVVTSSHEVTLSIPVPPSPNRFNIIREVGQHGQVEIVPDRVGPASVDIVAVCKGISRTRNVSVLVRHTAPVWTEGTSLPETVFVGAEFERVVMATCSGKSFYSISGRKPVRSADVAEVGLESGIIRALLTGDTVVSVRANAPDEVANGEDAAVIVTTYDPGQVYGASADHPDGPPILQLLERIRSKLRFGVFVHQIGDDEPLRYFPQTDQVSLRDGGIIVYSLSFEADQSSSALCAVRIPGIASVLHKLSATGTVIDVEVHAPSADAPAGNAPAGSVARATGTVDALDETPGNPGATITVQWDRDGSVRVCGSPQGRDHWDVVYPGAGGLPPEVKAVDVSFDVDRASACAIGDHMLATFARSARVYDWRSK